MLRAMLVLVVVGIILFVGLSAVEAQQQQAIEAQGTDETVTDEQLDITNKSGKTLTLNESNRLDVRYGNQSTVTVTQNGTNFDPAGNWAWNQGGGTITIDENTNLNTSAGAAPIEVDYQYREATDEQALISELAVIPYGLGDLLLVAGGAAVVLGGLAILRRAG